MAHSQSAGRPVACTGSNRPQGLFSVQVPVSHWKTRLGTSCDCWAPVPSKRHWFRASMAAWSNTRLGSASTTWTLDTLPSPAMASLARTVPVEMLRRAASSGNSGRPSSGPWPRREPARRNSEGQDKGQCGGTWGRRCQGWLRARLRRWRQSTERIVEGRSPTAACRCHAREACSGCQIGAVTRVTVALTNTKGR